MTSIETIYEAYLTNRSVCTDTRAIIPGSIFFALKGPSFNGNAFAEQALLSGASFAVIDEPAFKKGDRYFLVEDVLTALQKLAAHHRSQLSIPVLAVTGSNGKTTTKELVRAVLSKKFKTLATKGNLNNHIGVPLTLLSITSDIAFAVIEMGANHQHEIELLCSIASPDFGLITNVGKAHLEGFGGFEGVKKGKGEMYKALSSEGRLAFVNSDSQHLKEMAAQYKPSKILYYGTGSDLYCSGELLSSEPTLHLKWRCESAFGEIQTQLIGAYNFENILSAISIGNYFRVKPEDISEAIAAYIPDNSRSQIVQKGNNTIVLDAYNANPTSMEAALKNFSKMEGANKIICVGDMAELGDESKAEHARIIQLLKTISYSQLILVGKNFGEFNHELPNVHFLNSELATEWLKSNQQHDSLFLVKGSRSSRMEKLLEAI
ncbi:MAG: UDP-N-acetylmuramoyl-tripeptide--D-alanyl-D-alanine ligase [Bacteroidetes bacterium]|nr:UDP-N-acetylmuramoyl-tripeptide--D-alanyl-D-alanine ligase [Bacteroidota bacterium]